MTSNFYEVSISLNLLFASASNTLFHTSFEKIALIAWVCTVSIFTNTIEQDADVVMFIYRDYYYNKESKELGGAEVIASKQRNGPTGTVKLMFLKELTRFESLTTGSTNDQVGNL